MKGKTKLAVCVALCWGGLSANAENRFVSNDGTWRARDASGVELEGTCHTSLTNALVRPNGCVIWVKDDYDSLSDATPMRQDGSMNARYEIPGGVSSLVIRGESGDWRTGPTLRGRQDADVESGCGTAALRVFAKGAQNSSGIELVGLRLEDGGTPTADLENVSGWAGCILGTGAANRLTLRNCLIAGGASGMGGGVAECTLVNCVVSNNVAVGSGGGCYQSVCADSVICANGTRKESAYYGGGGLAGGSATNCVIECNETPASAHGGGAFAADLHACVVRGNSSGRWGGGTSRCTTYCCIVTNNLQRTESSAVNAGGGGTYGGTNYNALIAFNTANNQGGGDYAGVCYNCTIVSNVNTLSRGQYAGGVDAAVLVNSISAGNVGALDSVKGATNSCVQGAAVTDARYIRCVNGDPKFDAAFRPRARACRDTGLLLDWMIVPTDARARDLAGNPRVDGSAPDMGCYEIEHFGLLLLFR